MRRGLPALGPALIFAAACGRVGYEYVGSGANGTVDDAAVYAPLDAAARPDTRDAPAGATDTREGPSGGLDASLDRAVDAAVADGPPAPRVDGASPDVQGPPPVVGPVAIVASDVFELNGAAVTSGRVFLTYDASSRLHLVELDGTGRPRTVAQNLGDQTVLDQGVVLPLANRMLLVFSNHSFSSEWFLYGVTFSPPAAPDVAQRFEIGPRVLECRSPTLLALGTDVVVSWRYGGGSIGYARIAPPGTVSAATLLDNKLTNGSPKRLHARGAGVALLASSATASTGYVLEQVDAQGARTANALEGVATSADLALGAPGPQVVYARDRVIYSQPLTTSLVPRDTPVPIHTSATPISLVQANSLSAGMLLTWVTTTGLYASHVDSAGRASSPVLVSVMDAAVARVRTLETAAGVLVIWHEQTPTNVLKAAAITAP